MEKWIDDDDDGDVDDRQFLVHVHVHVPFGHPETTGGIDDDMNNEHVHFFVFPSFFSCSLLRYLAPGYLLRGIDGTHMHLMICNSSQQKIDLLNASELRSHLSS